MIKFNFLLALQRLLRNKLYTAISVASISIAFAIVLFLLNFVVHELKTDQFHENKEQIVRIITKWEGRPFFTHTPLVLAPTLKKELPTIKNYVRINNYNSSNPIDVHTETISGKEENIFYADPSFFEVFSFPIVIGSFEKMNETPNALVISESKAKKYFGDQNPIGQLISINFYDDNFNKAPLKMEVVAVMKDIPSASTIQTDFITNIEKKFSDHWGAYSVETYLQIHPNTDYEEVEKQIAETVFKHYNNQFNNEPDYDKWKIQPLTDIHFNSDYIEGGSSGSLIFIKILAIISILIMIVAFFNYLLLNSSLSIKYFKTKKILSFNGATNKGDLIQENIYTFIQILLSLLLAAPLAKIIHYNFSTYLGENYQFILYNNPLLIFTILICCMGFGFVIALFLSQIFTKSFHRIQNKSINLKNQQSHGSFFIVVQIIVFTALLMSSLVLVKQMNFILKKDPGCNIDNIISLSIRPDNFQKTQTMRDELLKASFITNISHGVSLQSQSSYKIDKIEIENGPEKTVEAVILQGDNEFINVYEIPIVLGRNLNPEKFPKSYDDFFLFHKPQIEVLVNKTFANQLDVDNVIGTTLKTGDFNDGIIVGVVEDFHIESYYNPIKPTIIAYDLNGITSAFSVKFVPGYLNETKKFVEGTYNKIYPGVLFQSWYYNHQEAYQKDINRAKLISGLTLVVIIISLLGLIGWSLLSTENKTKEIGIRKVNGAKTGEVLAMLNKDFIIWVTIAFIVATPIAYYAMNKWLENFAYKTELSWWIFAFAGMLALGIALLTVSWQSWRAATRNPVEALRYE